MVEPPTHVQLACFLPSLEGGGAERATVNLLGGFVVEPSSASWSVDLVLGRAVGAFLAEVPQRVQVVELGQSRVTRAIGPLAGYLERARPRVLLSQLSHANLAALLAARRVRPRPRVILVEHLTLSAYRGQVYRDLLIRPLARWLYPQADAVVAVSEGAARDWQQQLRWPPGSVRVIHNAVVTDGLPIAAEDTPPVAWLGEPEVPVFLGLGRLVPQKDFALLIEAFRRVRRDTAARLVILGEGPQRGQLERQIRSAGLTADVALPGFVTNPYACLRRAAAFVLSSRWEALPMALIEALACGCPVVATDCPTGPAEILEHGRWGVLAPVGDAAALADAMRQTLVVRPDANLLRQRAQDFSARRAAQRYSQLIRELDPL